MGREAARGAVADPSRQAPHRLVADLERCNGCQACMVACSLVHDGVASLAGARIQVITDPFSGVHAIHYCRQCSDAACAEACPHGAIEWSDAMVCWLVDEDLCVGCGLCVEACPFEAIHLSRDRGVAFKCDTCQGHPACVASCPRDALAWRSER